MSEKPSSPTDIEVAVTGLDGAHAHIRNNGTEVIYTSKTTGVDKAIFILVKNREMLCNITSWLFLFNFLKIY